MPDIKGQLRFDRHFDLAGKHALSERAALFILEHLSDAAKLVDKTGHAGIRRSNHWATRFYAAKDCIRQVLMRSSGPLKPPVVRHIYEQVRAGTCLVWKGKLPVSSPIVSSKQINGATWTSPLVRVNTVCSFPSLKSPGT